MRQPGHIDWDVIKYGEWRRHSSGDIVSKASADGVGNPLKGKTRFWCVNARFGPLQDLMLNNCRQSKRIDAIAIRKRPNLDGSVCFQVWVVNVSFMVCAENIARECV